MNRLMQFIDFGGLQGGGFQNALATGLQMGQAAGEARSRRAMNNALAAFDPSKPETLQPIMREDARVGMQLRGQMDAAQAQAQQGQKLDRETYARLLKMAGDNPQRAYSAAQQMGLDLTGLPEIGSPEFEQWRQTELFVLDALSDPEKMTAIQQDAQARGLDIGTPEGRRAVQELTLYKYAKQGVDELGRPTLELPQIAIPAPGAQSDGGASILPRSARPAGMSDDQLFEAARRRVEAGANVDAVFRQLREWGVEVN